MKSRLSLIACLLFLIGCCPTTAPTGAVECNGVDCYKKSVEGHEYLVFRISSGSSALHSESCPCRRTAEKVPE